MFAVCVVCAFVFLYNYSTMPESVTVLKKENNALKAQLSSMSDEIAKLKELIQRHRTAVQFCQEKKVPTV